LAPKVETICHRRLSQKIRFQEHRTAWEMPPLVSISRSLLMRLSSIDQTTTTTNKDNIQRLYLVDILQSSIFPLFFLLLAVASRRVLASKSVWQCLRVRVVGGFSLHRRRSLFFRKAIASRSPVFAVRPCFSRYLLFRSKRREIVSFLIKQ
jgi:hypothetical protein